MEGSTNTQILRARDTDPVWVWIFAVAIPLMLIAPALWNGYPLLQYDTGGYLARWYEGYLVPSRSTVFGLYLHFGEDSSFWLNLGIQALATLWILQLTLRVFGMLRPLRLAGLSIALVLTTALPWLASMLLTDIFAGLSVLSLFLLILHGDKISPVEKIVLFAFTAFAAATHSATLAVLLGLCCAGWIARPLLGARIAVAGLVQGSLTIVAGAAMLLSANFALSGQVAWTPGGTGVAFGRMLQDGIVARYLRDHCPQANLKLCPYRDELPATADQFLWGNSMFNTLGRFQGMNDEMDLIVTRSLAEYPFQQTKAAIAATAQQLVHVATGEGTNGWIPHTYGIIERYLPAQLTPMRAAHQQHWDLNFAAINWIHVPVALVSVLLVVAIFGSAIWRRQLDDLTLLAATVSFALLGNAFICGVISGPHDRYGARMAWIATFVVLIAALRHFTGRDERRENSFSP
jgi:MFS family permease